MIRKPWDDDARRDTLRDTVRTSKRVLVVEDHEDIGELLRTLIETEGHSCRVVGTLRSALRHLKSGSFDLVFVDLDLPEGDGQVVARHAAGEAPGTEVILLSAALAPSSKAAYRRLGIRKCILKPFRGKTILKALR